MGLARTLGVGLTGISAQLVEIEADLGQGLPGMTFTGLADTAVRESVHRIRSAVQNSDATWPNRRITVALLPADLRKVGSRFDLAIAMAVLASDDAVPAGSVREIAWIAEVGLDGRLRPVPGVLPSVAAVQDCPGMTVVVAPANGAEAALVPGVDVRVATDLREIMAWLNGEGPPPAAPAPLPPDEPAPGGPDLGEVAGQALAKRAIEVAAAGGHHVYLVGAPGAGKTMLAERLPGLLPPLTDVEALGVTAVHSVAGLLGPHARLIRRAPLQAPHHTASIAALVGGGSHLGRPGAISLAHAGVLFLDEAPEFSGRALDALRQPLESGRVVLHRSGGAVDYPARFLLVLAANPCPCGSKARDCSCAAQVRRRYQHRLSGPLLDRIDVRVEVDPVPHAELFEVAAERESSATVAARVAAARAAAAERWAVTPWRLNGAIPGATLRAAPWRLSRAALAPAELPLQRGQLSARGFDRVLRLSWTLADLAGRCVPAADDVAEALYFRTGSAEGFAA
jgi:magnesium chelatase family protein